MGSTDSGQLQALLAILKAAGVTFYKSGDLELHIEPAKVYQAPTVGLAVGGVAPDPVPVSNPYHELFGAHGTPQLKRAK